MRQLVIDDLIQVCWEGDLNFWKVFFPVYLRSPLSDIRFTKTGYFEWVDYTVDRFRADLDSLSDSKLLELHDMCRTPEHGWWELPSVELYLINENKELEDLLDSVL